MNKTSSWTPLSRRNDDTYKQKTLKIGSPFNKQKNDFQPTCQNNNHEDIWITFPNNEKNKTKQERQQDQINQNLMDLRLESDNRLYNNNKNNINNNILTDTGFKQSENNRGTYEHDTVKQSAELYSLTKLTYLSQKNKKIQKISSIKLLQTQRSTKVVQPSDAKKHKLITISKSNALQPLTWQLLIIFFLITFVGLSNATTIKTTSETDTETPRTTPCICPLSTTSQETTTPDKKTTDGEETTSTSNCICPDEITNTNTIDSISTLSEVESATAMPSNQRKRRRRKEAADLDLFVDDFDQKIIQKLPFAKFA